MADIIYTPQFQPPAWRDNVDFVAAEGPGGFNVQFQSLQTELAALSGIVKQLSDAILNTNQTLQATGMMIQTLKPATRVIQAACWGNINSDGTIASSSGNFTVKKVGAGLYDIFFTSAFSAIPTVQANQVWRLLTDPIPLVPTGNTKDNTVLIGVTLSQCRIKTGGVDGVGVDRSFSFLAYGPTT